MKRTLTLLVGSTLLFALVFIPACSEDESTPPPTKELTVFLDPSEIYLGAGSSATVNLKIMEGNNVVSWQAVLKYDPSRVQISSLKVRELTNNFLAKGGATLIESDKLIDSDNGRIVIGALAQRTGFAGEDGDGVLAQFKISSPTADASSMITIESVSIYTHPISNPPTAVAPKKVDCTVRKGS